MLKLAEERFHTPGRDKLSVELHSDNAETDLKILKTVVPEKKKISHVKMYDETVVGSYECIIIHFETEREKEECMSEIKKIIQEQKK